MEGKPREVIAAEIGVTRKTLSKHFAAVLPDQRRKPKVTGGPLAKQESPLDYMLSVMNDVDADVARRDRMAIAAAPFVHSRVGEIGIKAQRQLDAENADEGSPWADLMQQPPPRSN
jgi:phage terminase small subunit